MDSMDKAEKRTIRLHGSSFINDMELDDRYKIVKKSLWISLLSLVGNPEGATVTLEESASPFLTMDLEKQLAQSLEDEPADFLVVDMCYTAGHGLYKWNGQVFTKNPKFLESSFFAEHEQEMEFIDVMRDREFDWKPYMDRYLELIGKYFDADHIILVRSRCPLWYVTHTHVRRYKRRSRRAYNRRIKELENYFVKKMNPYVVDIYSHYFIDFDNKRGVTMSTYEKPFYHHAKRIISTIIRTQPEQRVFREQEYFMRLGRFIKYYDNLFAKNNTNLFMDEDDFLDHLVLQLSREILIDYESDLVEIEACVYSSIQEILDGHSFKFAQPLRECLKVVKAVEEGDLFREDTDYDMIFEHQLKIVEPFAQLVRREWEQQGLAAGTVHVNRFNCRDYYKALLAAQRGKAALLKKCVSGIGGNMEERHKVKMLVRSRKRETKNGILAYCHALNEYYEPVRVDLWGSCITREILNEDKGRFQIGKYAYRNCCLFAFDEPIPYEEEKFEDLSLFEDSNWRVGYIRSAFHKDLPEQLKQTGSEWLLLDFYDLVCDIVEYQGGILTADSEVRGLKFYKEIKEQCTVTAIDDVLDEEEIKRRFDMFIRFIRERYGKKIVWIKADVKLKFLDQERQLKPMRWHKREVLLEKRKFMDRWQKYFEKHMDCYVIDYAKRYHADDLCVSGAFMVHYEKEFYERGYQALYEIIYEGKGKRYYK